MTCLYSMTMRMLRAALSFIEKTKCVRMIHKIRAIAELIDAANQPSMGNLFHSRIRNLDSQCIGKASAIDNQKWTVKEIRDLCIQLLRDVQPIVFHRYDFIRGYKILLALRPGG